MNQADFPKILGFCCRWCSYAGADLAGSMRLQYPPAIRIMMVPCTGRVDILHLLKAFELGFDAVFVSGCHIGDCHYLAGNIRTVKRVAKLKKDLAAMGIEPERLEMFHVASGESAVVKSVVDAHPSLVSLARDIGFRGFPLGVEAVELLFQPLVSGFAGVDGATDRPVGS